jgi:hypothetical protein
VSHHWTAPGGKLLDVRYEHFQTAVIDISDGPG